MKLQIDQIESFDNWLSQTEHLITKDLDLLNETSTGIQRQYEQLAQLQDELVSQQQITESLQNMIIVVDDSSSSNENDSISKYTSSDIEQKLLNLSERWANICNFVQTRWVQLQEIKPVLEKVEKDTSKIELWLTNKEQQIQQILTENNLSNTDVLMQHVNLIEVKTMVKRKFSMFFLFV